MNPPGLIKEIIRRITNLETQMGRKKSDTPLYAVLNENTPAQLTGNQNDYDPGNYDVLLMSSDASRTITGISGGKKGRLLKIINTGTQAIVLAHQSASSAIANRIISPNAANITLATTDSADLYYDSTAQRWRITFTSL